MASGTAEAELVALGIGQDGPVPVTLADVCLPCAKGEQAAELGRLRELRERGLTLLLVEHNIPVIQRLCDTVAVLNAGQVMAHGQPGEVLSDREVREAFLGE